MPALKGLASINIFHSPATTQALACRVPYFRLEQPPTPLPATAHHQPPPLVPAKAVIAKQKLLQMKEQLDGRQLYLVSFRRVYVTHLNSLKGERLFIYFPSDNLTIDRK